MTDTRYARSLYPTLLSYVRTTRRVLLAQVAAALLAALATGLMLLWLAPLMRERDQLNSEKTRLQTANVEATTALEATQSRLQRLAQESDAVNSVLAALRSELSETREKLDSAIHKRMDVQQDLERMRTTAIAQQKLAAKEQEASAAIVKQAVDAFHARDYTQAIDTYNNALRVDPLNVHIINLR
jgi:septal ring factor EnvC (AmiA/AmiB activator)